MQKVFVAFLTTDSDQHSFQLYQNININPNEVQREKQLADSEQIKTLLYDKMMSSGENSEVFETFWDQIEKCCRIETLDEFFDFHLNTYKSGRV